MHPSVPACLPLAALALSIPLHFEPNRGQAQPGVRYVAAAQTYVLFLSDTGIAMNFPGGGSLRMNCHLPRSKPSMCCPARPLLSRANMSDWHTDIPNYARVRYGSVYPASTSSSTEKQQRIEYDWMVAPGAGSRVHSAFVHRRVRHQGGRERRPCPRTAGAKSGIASLTSTSG